MSKACDLCNTVFLKPCNGRDECCRKRLEVLEQRTIKCSYCRGAYLNPCNGSNEKCLGKIFIEKGKAKKRKNGKIIPRKIIKNRPITHYPRSKKRLYPSWLGESPNKKRRVKLEESPSFAGKARSRNRL